MKTSDRFLKKDLIFRFHFCIKWICEIRLPPEYFSVALNMKLKERRLLRVLDYPAYGVL